MNKNWHPDHLRCCECNQPINSVIEEKDGKAYCHKDYQKLFGICCNKCHEPILSGGYITALDKPWHVDCFVCNVSMIYKVFFKNNIKLNQHFI